MTEQRDVAWAARQARRARCGRCLRRVLTVLAAGLVGTVALYVVGMNVLLRTRLFRNAISSDPGSLRVEYATAYSLVPGRIHVEGLQIRGRDSHVEWILAIDRCDFRTSFTELLHRRFHASDVRADGLSLRLRLRRDTANPGEDAALPPVPGFMDPPLTDVGPPEAPLTDENYNLWSIRLDGVDVRHVRELWIDTLRYTGDLHVTGRWFFRPIRRLEVGPAVVDMTGPMDVSYGKLERWATGVTGKLHVTVHPTDLQDMPIARFVHAVSIRGDVRGTAELERPLDRISPAVEFVRARPTVEARVDLDHGVLVSGTRVVVEPFDAEVTDGDLSFDGSLDARFEVGADGRAAATAACGRLTALQGRYPLARARSVVAELTTRDLDLAEWRTPRIDGSGVLSLRGQRASIDDSASFEAPDIEVVSLATVARALHFPASVSLDGGSGHANLRASLDLTNATWTGAAAFETHGLRARIGADAMAGQLRVALRAASSRGVVDVSGSTVSFTGVPAAGAEPWWARVEVANARLDRQSTRLRATVFARAKDASPLAALIKSTTSVPGVLVDAVSTKDLEVQGQVLMEPSTFEARSVTARSEGIDADLEYRSSGSKSEWALLLDLGLMSAGIHGETGGKTELQLLDSRPWFEKKAASVKTSFPPDD